MAETKIKRRPIRAALYGLLLGISIWYFLQFEFATFGLDSIGGVVTRAIIVIVATMAVAVIWAYVAPARKPKGAPPADTPDAPAAPVAAGDGTPSLPSDDE